jgi:hypothetical protein
LRHADLVLEQRGDRVFFGFGIAHLEWDRECLRALQQERAYDQRFRGLGQSLIARRRRMILHFREHVGVADCRCVDGDHGAGFLMPDVGLRVRTI